MRRPFAAAVAITIAAVATGGCGLVDEDLTSRCRVTEAGFRAKQAGEGSEDQGDEIGEIYRTSSGCHPLDEQLRD